MPTKTPQALPASEAKKHFGEVLNRCVFGNEPVFIKRHDKTIAVVISFEEWKKHHSEQTEEEDCQNNPLYQKIMKLKKDIAEYQRKNPQPKGPTNEEIIKQAREERTKKVLGEF